MTVLSPMQHTESLVTVKGSLEDEAINDLEAQMSTNATAGTRITISAPNSAKSTKNARKVHRHAKSLPVPRICHSVQYFPSSYLIMANGITSTPQAPTPLADLWKFNLETKKWHALFDYSSQEPEQVRLRRLKAAEAFGMQEAPSEAPNSSASGKFGCASFLDVQNKRFYVFGGVYSVPERLSDWSGTLEELIRVHEAGRVAPEKSSDASPPTESPEQSTSSPPLQFHTDLFVYDLEKKYWRRIKRMPGADVVWPCSSCFGTALVHRGYHAPDDDSEPDEDTTTENPSSEPQSPINLKRTYAFLFGGYPIATNTNLYRYSFERQQWTIQPASNSHIVSGRWSHQMVSTERSLYIIFGRNSQQCLNDLFEYSFVHQKWRKLEPEEGSLIPEGRYGHSAVLTKRHSIFVFGGILESGKKTNELLEFSLKRRKWRSVKLLHKMHPRAFHTSVLTESQQMICYGGVTNDGTLITGIDEIFVGRKKRVPLPEPKPTVEEPTIQPSPVKKRRKIRVKKTRGLISPDDRVYNYQLPIKRKIKVAPSPSPVYKLVDEDGNGTHSLMPFLPKLGSSVGQENLAPRASNKNLSPVLSPVRSRPISPRAKNEIVPSSSAQHVDDLVVVSHQTQSIMSYEPMNVQRAFNSRHMSNASNHPALRHAQAQSEAAAKYLKERSTGHQQQKRSSMAGLQSKLPQILRNHHTTLY